MLSSRGERGTTGCTDAHTDAQSKNIMPLAPDSDGNIASRPSVKRILVPRPEIAYLNA